MITTARTAVGQTPDTVSTDLEVPSLASLLAISYRPSTLEPGQAVVLAPNYGQRSSMEPVQGRQLPLVGAPGQEDDQFDAAAGPAPRDPQIPVYIVTPNPPDSRYVIVPSVDVAEAQSNVLQVIAAGPVGYVPGGIATLPSVYPQGG